MYREKSCSRLRKGREKKASEPKVQNSKVSENMDPKSSRNDFLLEENVI